MHTKAKFRVVTAQQDVDFRDELELLRKNSTLAQVLAVSRLMRVLSASYLQGLGKLNKTKVELVNALNLFGLDEAVQESSGTLVEWTNWKKFTTYT